MSCANIDHILDYISGCLSAEETRFLDEHFASCAACRVKRDEAGNMVRGLGPADDEFGEPRFVARVIETTRESRPRQNISPRPSRYGLLSTAVGVAMAACLAGVLVVSLRSRSEPPSTLLESALGPGAFVARSGGPKGANLWESITIYRADARGYFPVQDRIAANDGLAFAYLNRSAQPFDYLMIFAVDPTGEVFWYYPAYENPGQNPTSIPIRAAHTRERLPEEIHHQLKPGRLRVYAIFTRTPVTVSSVEERLGLLTAESHEPDVSPRLGIENSAEQSFALIVTQ